MLLPFSSYVIKVVVTTCVCVLCSERVDVRQEWDRDRDLSHVLLLLPAVYISLSLAGWLTPSRRALSSLLFLYHHLLLINNAIHNDEDEANNSLSF